jgi:hypothetical protein
VKHEEGALGEGADKLDLVRRRTKVHALLVRRDVDPEVKRRKRGKDQKTIWMYQLGEDLEED